MKKIILLFFLILNISCNHKSISEKVDENHIVSDKEVYSFLNFILEKESKSITNCRNEYVLELIEENPDLKKLFTDKDLIYLKKQTKTEKNFSLNPEYLNNDNVIPQKTIKALEIESKSMDVFWEKFEKKYGTESFISVSLPLFSLDRKIVIINTNVLNKDGFGASGTQVYRKINGEWKLYKNYTSSIS